MEDRRDRPSSLTSRARRWRVRLASLHCSPGWASSRSSLFAFLFLPSFHRVPDRPRAPRTATHGDQFTLQNYAHLTTPDILEPTARASRSAWSPPSPAGSSGSCSPMRSSPAACRGSCDRPDDVLRRRLELRRRAPGAGLHLHARPARLVGILDLGFIYQIGSTSTRRRHSSSPTCTSSSRSWS